MGPLGSGEAGHHSAQVQLVDLGEEGILLRLREIPTHKNKFIIQMTYHVLVAVHTNCVYTSCRRIVIDL